ncbi:MAG: 4Fe-4S dicluster domain-containing protein [Armatimonadetes bacterium]|nr:4Fe-4S dicluster domain-containing protein [Armatimonadota bacterium]
MTQTVARKGLVVIHAERCKSCEWCVRHCPTENLRIGAGTNTRGHRPAEVIDPENCTGCGQCALVCPDVCIEVYRARRSTSRS